MKFRSLCLALAGAVAMTVSAQAQQPPVRIGVTLPLTGNVAFDGKIALHGMEAAAKVVNDGGGILGRQVVLVPLDDKANPEEGVNAVKRLIADEKVDALATAMNSSVGLAQVDAAKEQILHMIVLASAPAITDKGYANVFRVNSTSASKETPLIDMMGKKMKSVTIISVNDDFGRGVVDMYKKAWGDGKGPEIKSISFVQNTETDFMPYLTKLKFENADGVFINLMSSQLATAMKQAAQIGITGKPVWTAGGGLNPTLIKLGGTNVEGVISSDNYIPGNPSPENARFKDTLAKIYPGEAPQLYHAIAYDAIMTIAQGMKDAGSVDDWKKVAAAMHKMTYTGPRGTLTFDGKGQVSIDAFVVQVKDGNVVQVK